MFCRGISKEPAYWVDILSVSLLSETIWQGSASPFERVMSSLCCWGGVVDGVVKEMLWMLFDFTTNGLDASGEERVTFFSLRDLTVPVRRSP